MNIATCGNCLRYDLDRKVCKIRYKGGSNLKKGSLVVACFRFVPITALRVKESDNE